MDTARIVQEVGRMMEGGESVGKALEKVANGAGLSLSATRKRYYRNIPKKTHHRNSALTEEEESILVAVSLAYSNVDMGWSTAQLQENVKIMFSKVICARTCTRFVERHKDVFSSLIVKPLGAGRVKLGLYEQAMNWVTSMSGYLGKKNPPSKAVVNYDESRIHITIEGKLKIKRLVSKSKRKAQTRSQTKGTHCGTFFTLCICFWGTSQGVFYFQIQV